MSNEQHKQFKEGDRVIIDNGYSRLKGTVVEDYEYVDDPHWDMVYVTFDTAPRLYRYVSEMMVSLQRGWMNNIIDNIIHGIGGIAIITFILTIITCLISLSWFVGTIVYNLEQARRDCGAYNDTIVAHIEDVPVRCLWYWDIKVIEIPEDA